MKPSPLATFAPNAVVVSLAALASSALLLSPASASPNGFRVQAGPDQSFAVTGAIDETSSSAISRSGVMNGLQGAVGTASFSAAAGPGIARTSINASYSTQPGWGFNAGVQAVSTTDLRIDGPNGVVPISTSINVHVDGTITIPSCGVGSGCDITVFLRGPSQRNLEVSATFGVNQSNANFAGLTIDNVQGGKRVHGDVAVPIDVMSNTPFTITLAVGFGGRGSAVGTYSGDYYTPDYQISFSPTGVLFNDIPAGYTVSGENVVNNHWTNPFESAAITVTDCNDPALASLTTVTGSLIIRNLPLCTQIALPNLVSVSGDLIITGNASLTTINADSMETIGGDLDISNNAAGAVINVGSLMTVGGDLVLDTSQGGSFNGNNGQTGGDLDLTYLLNPGGDLVLTDDELVAATTGAGRTDVTLVNATAAMEALIPAGAFSSPVSFTITGKATDPSANGTAADGSAATISPILSYEFAFAVPTLNVDASLTFTIDMTALDAAETAALLNALAGGNVSIIGKGDAPGSAYAAFPLCVGAQTPALDACAAVSLLDASGQPTGGSPAFVRFDGVVGHFSSYGVGIITKIQVDAQPPVVVRNTTADSCSLAGDNGWCRGTQTAGFSASDTGSAISAPCAASAGASCAFTRTAAANGASVQIASGVICDALNNCNPGIAAGPFKIDSIVPMLVPSISPQSVQQGMLATASANASDATSGIASSSCDAVDTSTVGQHTVQCRARDNAGNTATASLTYTVVAQTPGDGQGRCGTDDDDDHDGHHGRGDHDDDHDDHDHHGSMPGWWPRSPGRFEPWSRGDDWRFGGR